MASLGVGPADLLNDLNTMGLMFEAMCMRDLRVYADAIDGKVYHYRDKTELECDAVVHLRNGRYGLVEIKLGGDRLIAEGVATLEKLAGKIDTDRMPEPAFKMVLTGTGKYAYRRKDGIYIVPVGCLGTGWSGGVVAVARFRHRVPVQARQLHAEIQEEFHIVDEISLEQTSGFFDKTEKPFHAHALPYARCSALVACLEVYGGPKSHKQSDAGHRFPVACDPFFLLGGSGSDNEYGSSGGIDDICDCSGTRLRPFQIQMTASVRLRLSGGRPVR